ncbi:class I SAM-dependent methyltransferase [Clostridium beijerinckii]|uniref:SAM-dependent methyltransferase n=1 Tax=Clostridium beijerinckii TaxID=1520 RepID=A0A1S9N424_CLOBE|nr:class I SAM-dependent methyltransferase [Clostridium beijerinckii]MZK53811.1 methyltransferase domain-containing protein [Clostridium beijerinckii]MZK60790.1 methyltransferase domain-containing protein [Clostridium beijerinckii]MZK72126.1 methyltransferase domain-containing protein [Clostridium beijerinckii]MZK77542.1 methyltransferase domain-containing protein [Clostridium beijerinckii]MZK87082.1 methyltransferase domain-containing protein [Clostridium beijerinckii]
MSEFWEKNFSEKQAMWGFEPSSTAIVVADYFAENNLKDILIPGVGYGRNVKPFVDNNMEVTGIEISQTAINIARENGINNKIYHGSVSDMPFENKLYDGVASFALIHLLNEDERKKFINDCYNHLKPGGYMIFTAVSEKAPMYGNGTKLAENYYETTYGVKLFFYNFKSIEKEFGNYGLVDFVEIDDIYKDNPDKPPVNFLMIKCRKEI